jgi:hypothetical protein
MVISVIKLNWLLQCFALTAEAKDWRLRVVFSNSLNQSFPNHWTQAIPIQLDETDWVAFNGSSLLGLHPMRGLASLLPLLN